MRQLIVCGLAGVGAAVAAMFVGCESQPGEKITRTLDGGGMRISETREWVRQPNLFSQLPQGWTQCANFDAKGIPVCTYCPQPGAPSHPDIPEGCVLVDLLCNGGPYELWCGEVVEEDPEGEYSVLHLEFLDSIGPTLGDDGDVVFRFQVHQEETFPLVELQGTVTIMTPAAPGVVYAPGVDIPAWSVVELSCTASELAFNLYFLGFDRLAFDDDQGQWEIMTLKYLCEQEGAPVVDLPYVFLALNGVLYGDPYDVRSN